ncbi:MAG: hypothetical protein M1826_004987 [Phylliscum demangeonii]|nr:MAG: hypothetical protein M1826_004987 [Phylliscum demangeonii]
MKLSVAVWSVAAVLASTSTALLPPPHLPLPSPPCTTTLNLLLPFQPIFTSVSYVRTKTSTSLVNCHGCSAVVVHNIAGIGPQRHPTTTVTSPLTTKTTFECAAFTAVATST